MFELNGKIVMVTGGAGGIGLCMVKELLKNGAQGIVIADTNSQIAERAIKEMATNKVLFVKTDVTNARQLEDAFKFCITKFQRMDLLLNNAGILNDRNWEKQIEINCTALVRGTLLGMKYMGMDKGGKGGMIVNTGSILGLMGASGCPVYTGTKHFVVGFSRSMGTPFYMERTGVRVLTICPGVTDTVLITGAKMNGLEMFDGSDAMLYEQLMKKLTGQPAENVARGLMDILRKGENGSTWIIEENKPAYEQKPLNPTIM